MAEAPFNQGRGTICTALECNKVKLGELGPATYLKMGGVLSHGPGPITGKCKVSTGRVPVYSHRVTVPPHLHELASSYHGSTGTDSLHPTGLVTNGRNSRTKWLRNRRIRYFSTGRTATLCDVSVQFKVPLANRSIQSGCILSHFESTFRNSCARPRFQNENQMWHNFETI